MNATTTSVEVVLVDDHPLFTEGLALLLNTATAGRVRVVARTARAAMAAELVRRHRPTIAIVDLAMPPPGGEAAIRALRRAAPDTRVLALSGLPEAEAAAGALRAGAHGFLPKTAEPAALVHPLLTLAEGWSVLPPAVLAGLLDDATRPGAAVLARLGDDERRLWRLVAMGEGTDRIATQLLVSERTAKRLVAGLLRTIGARNRVEAAALAGRSGLLDD